VDKIHHPTLAAGRWKTLTFCEQMGNIGSEISRAAKAPTRERCERAVDRALELLDLTIANERGLRQRELLRVRELIADVFFGGMEYGETFESLLPFFDAFAIVAHEHGA